MYPECVAFLRKTIRVREIVILVHLSHSHGFAQKRNAFRIHGTAPSRGNPFGIRLDSCGNMFKTRLNSRENLLKIRLNSVGKAREIHMSF